MSYTICYRRTEKKTWKYYFTLPLWREGERGHFLLEFSWGAKTFWGKISSKKGWILLVYFGEQTWFKKKGCVCQIWTGQRQHNRLYLSKDLKLLLNRVPWTRIGTNFTVKGLDLTVMVIWVLTFSLKFANENRLH